MGANELWQRLPYFEYFLSEPQSKKHTPSGQPENKIKCLDQKRVFDAARKQGQHPRAVLYIGTFPLDLQIASNGKIIGTELLLPHRTSQGHFPNGSTIRGADVIIVCGIRE